MHTRLQHRVQRTRGTRDSDAGLVYEYVYPVAGVAESLMKPHRIGQQLLHALVLVGKNRERQHEQCLQIQRVGSEHGEIEPVPVRRTDQFEGHGARVRRQHRTPCPGAVRSEAAGPAPSGSPCAPHRLPAASPADGWRLPAVPAPVPNASRGRVRTVARQPRKHGPGAPLLQTAAQEVSLLARQCERRLARKRTRRIGQTRMPARLAVPDHSWIVSAGDAFASDQRREFRVVPALTLPMLGDAPGGERIPIHRAGQPHQ